MRNEIKYAGFLVRVFAAFIDGLILAIPIKFIESIFGYESILTIAMSLSLWWFYSSYMNSKHKGTIGKRILGLEILDTNRNQITFKQASLRFFISIFSYVFIFPILMMIFNKKKQTLHDYIAKTIVEDYIVDKQYKKKFLFLTIFRYAGIFIMVIISLFIAYQSISFMLFVSEIDDEKDKQDKTYYETYQTNDFNDTVILFYKKELEKYTREFIDADKMYEIFESRIKYGLALDCIRTRLDIYTEDIEMGNWYRRNARNEYLDTEKKVKKSKNNEAYLFEYGDVYDLKLANKIIDNILIIKENGNNTICEQKYPINKIYKLFIDIYSSSYYKQNISVAPSQVDIKQKKWYEILEKRL